MANTNVHNNLFSSLISDIKSYTGKDPLLPWLRGIRKITETLPPQLLKEKLPRFLQKCTQTFENDRRYSNDLRYLRVWLKLMDFVDDPGALLGAMKANHIGDKKSLFYQAYALYYEKLKKFEEADKMYHLGVQNLAEPVDELQKSYEQFLHRMKRYKNKRIQRQAGRTGVPLDNNDVKCNSESVRITGGATGSSLKDSLPETQAAQIIEDKNVLAQSLKNEMQVREYKDNGGRGKFGRKSCLKKQGRIEAESDDAHHCGLVEPTINTKEAMNAINSMFREPLETSLIDDAIVGKSKAEDACHHGLVEPTVNMKEAMDTISSMFREPLETSSLIGRASRRSKPKADHRVEKGFEVFVDENSDNGVGSLQKNLEKGIAANHQPPKEPFQIFIDDEESYEQKERFQDKEKGEQDNAPKMREGAFVFPNPKDLDMERLPQARFREDTAVFRFVGSTVSDEPKVENVCHHGLVEPTINLKEAMDDINSMFGKPIEFVRKRRPKKQEKTSDGNRNCDVFLILPDDDLDSRQVKLQSSSSSSRNESDLFEQTICTKEAMDEINKMFGMPLDF